ncbi:histidine kinase [Emticicia oligotrophica DSM 17448]|uniref:histidine kinase n=1 Tax=Emticicia oligotrophica (strain DSM 17448 / CIP 109782 / MTCC 6937 / GPTSA100-15) TaxID=929562 RepID=A0ABN4ASQ4_EMTOG|nr:HAMP domain-containing sensor histidine kinase [Emticicia oligotrophica]AFK04617.1 histidine kinase [Emticicia oligotrophica DSM 17448]
MKNFRVVFLLLYLVHFSAKADDILYLKQRLSQKIADTTKCQLLYDLGMKYEYQNPDSAIFFVNQSYSLAKKIKNLYFVAQAMYGLGYINIYYVKDDKVALEWLTKGIDAAKACNSYLYLARCYQLTGIIAGHQNTGNPGELYQKALEYASKSNDWKIQHDIRAILFNFLVGKKEFAKGEVYLREALEISRKNDIDQWFSGVLDYCDLLESQKRMKEANSFYKKLSDARPLLKKTKGLFVYMNDVGRFETKLKRYKEAEQTFKECLRIEINKPKIDTFHLFFLVKNLQGLYEKKGQFKEANEASKQLTEILLWLRDKRQTQDGKVQLTKLKAAMDLEKKESEIAILEIEKRQQLIIMLAISLILIIFISFAVFLQKKRQEINAQKEALAALNATKNKLLAILSHDLRSPLASLKNYLMLINWGALTQEEFSESVNRLNIQLSNVNNLLDNVLNWTITQMDAIKPQIGAVKLSEIIETKIQVFYPLLEAKHIAVHNRIPEYAEILFDSNHLRIVIRNLLQNALKFTKENGIIRFEFSEVGHEAIIKVTDNGVGIPKEKLLKLFELNQSDSTLGTAREQGTGLGLVLVKELIERNNGTIRVESEVDKGTTIIITCFAA